MIVVEIARRTLTRISPAGEKATVATFDGAAMGPEGRCYLCNSGGSVWVEDENGLRPAGLQPPDYAGGAIQRVDLYPSTAAGQIAVLATTHNLRCTPRGNMH